VGIICKDGIVMGSDRRSTAGNLVMNKNSKKVELITPYLLIAGTGSVSDIQMLKRVLGAELKLKELRSKQRPTVKEAASLAAMITFRNIRTPSMVPSIVGSLIGGFNTDGTFDLYTIEPAGSAVKVDDYDANFSSGMPFILGLLERNWKKDITLKQGVELATEALKSSTQRDTGSGHGIDIFTISKDEIKKVIGQEIVAEYK
jgi:proteasome beta subunit